MKKFIFSAIAMIAFVGSVMAKNVVNAEEAIFKDNNFITNLDLGDPVQSSFCWEIAADVLTQLDPNNEMSNEQSYQFYQDSYDVCMDYLPKLKLK